jgi:hypothetical protein
VSAMRKVATVTLCEQSFDLALGSKQHPHAGAMPRAALAREGEDLHGRPVALEVDLESELQTIGNVAFVEALLLLLAIAYQERDAARAALQKGAAA